MTPHGLGSGDVIENCPRIRRRLGAMAQIRCEILAHTIKLITPIAATVPLGIAAAQPRVSGKVCPNSVLTARGTEGSNLLSSSGESGANLIFGLT